MKAPRPLHALPVASSAAPLVARRGLVVGAGVAAGAAAVAALAAARGVEPAAEKVAAAAPAGEAGYRLSEHVLRYYETTRS